MQGSRCVLRWESPGESVCRKGGERLLLCVVLPADGLGESAIYTFATATATES